MSYDDTATATATAGDGVDAADDRLARYLSLAAELTRGTLGTTERLLAGFVRSGEVAADHAERLLDEVVARSADSGGAIADLVRSEVAHAVERAGLVRRADLDELRGELAQLRIDVARLSPAGAALGVARDALAAQVAESTATTSGDDEPAPDTGSPANTAPLGP